jgi:hypothetical protein
VSTRKVYEVTGAKQLRRTLLDAGAALSDLKDVNSKVGTVVATAGASRAPVRTGALAGSIRVANAAAKVTVRAGSRTLPYAGAVHWGWPARNIRPHPFLADAAQATEETWVGLYFAELERVVGEVKGA